MTEPKFTKNKRLMRDTSGHVGGSVYDKKSLIKNSDEEEYRARKEWEHQADINDVFGI